MGHFSGMGISSSPGLKNPLKLAHGQQMLSSQGPKSRGRQDFFQKNEKV